MREITSYWFDMLREITSYCFDVQKFGVVEWSEILESFPDQVLITF